MRHDTGHERRTIERREFLRTAGYTGGALALAACAPSLSPRVLRAMSAPGDQHRVQHDPHGLWAEAVSYARWTPSPHNIQPWRLRLLDAEHAELYCDPDRRLPDTDPTSAFTMLTLSMFAEYLALAMAARGQLLTATFVDTPIDYAVQAPVRVATLAFEPCPIRLDAARRRESLCHRQTSRLPYDGSCVHDGVLETIHRLSAQDGHRFEFTHDRAQVRDTIAINRDAVFADMDSDLARNELRKWIRPSDREAHATSDGLWARCMHYPGWLLRDFFDNHHAWTHGTRAALGKRLITHGMRGTRTVAWWSGPFTTPTHWVRAGQVFAHAWLMLAEAGVQLHPFGSVVTNVDAHQRFLRTVAHALRTPSMNHDAQEGEMWLLARLGYSGEPPRSLRIPSSAIFLEEIAS